MVTAPSFAATTRSMPPTRSPPMLACSRLMVSVPSPTVAGFLQGPLGDGAQHARSRHVGRRVGGRTGCEQRVDIDPARGEFAFGLCLRAEVKRELALHHLRAALGVNGNLEDRKLGAVRRGVELALELEGGKMRVRAGTLLA